MVDDGLAGLSREDLLELVRRQQAELTAREAAIPNATVLATRFTPGMDVSLNHGDTSDR
jgi:hypothetical protein